MVDSEGRWQLDLAPKQMRVIQLCEERGNGQKIIFVNGPKYTGKSVACLNAVVSHAWNTNGASINVVVPTVTAGDDSGIWSLLTEHVIPEWIEGDFGLDWWIPERGKKIKGARQKGASKKLYCEIRNIHGGKSHIEMNSLKDERDVEKNFFNRYFTMVYWGELQNFQHRHTFDTLLSSLRLKGHPEDDFVLLCDGNPASTGEDFWAHKLFFVDRLNPDLPEDQKPLQKKLRVIEIYLQDNPYLSDERKQEIISQYAHDPDLYARYILGKWVKASSDALFFSVFRPSLHVVGDLMELDPDMLVPEETCGELFTGWDPGSANPAMVIAEKVFRTVNIEQELYEKLGSLQKAREALKERSEKNGKEVEMTREETVYKFIDEIVIVKGNLTIAEFSELALEKILFWERWVGRALKWTHWSDRSAFDQREAISNRYQYEEVYAVTGGKVMLQAHERSQIRGTKAPSIRLIRKLTFQNRLFFSAATVPHLITMMKVLKRDKRAGMPTDSVDKNQDERHCFDALRYLTASEEWEELQNSVVSLVTAKRPDRPQLITVKL